MRLAQSCRILESVVVGSAIGGVVVERPEVQMAERLETAKMGAGLAEEGMLGMEVPMVAVARMAAA
jgi:membrane protease subunit (stomatin/prohibitin family)